MDARQRADDIGLGTRGLARERQAVADDVGDRVENVRRLIVVRQDDRVALLLSCRIAAMSSARIGHSNGGMWPSTRR